MACIDAKIVSLGSAYAHGHHGRCLSSPGRTISSVYAAIPQLAQRRGPVLPLATTPSLVSSSSSVKVRRTLLHLCRAGTPDAAAAAAAADVAPATAKDSVEAGLAAFEKREFQAALRLFERAMGQQPNDDEMRAALYNAACSHTKLRQWQPAVDCVVKAVNDYDLKLQVALEDADLAPLRERREWLDSLGNLVGGLSDGAYTQLRSEAKAPFRLARLILFGGLLAGASVGILIILIRLASALKGGEGAPEVNETLQNLAINGAAVAVLGFLVRRDLQSQQRDKVAVAREDSLGRLQVAVSATKQLPLASFRGSVRPVLIAGSRGHVAKALKSAEPLYSQLSQRGVCLVPLELNADDPGTRLKALKAEFSSSSGSAKGFSGSSSSSSRGGEAAGGSEAKKEAAAQVTKKDVRWQLEAYEVDEWLVWLDTQKKAAGVKGDNVWVQVQLDGTVRSSGVGTPPWTKLISDLPELGDVRTKLTDGIGT